MGQWSVWAFRQAGKADPLFRGLEVSEKTSSPLEGRGRAPLVKGTAWRWQVSSAFLRACVKINLTAVLAKLVPKGGNADV